MIVPKIVLELGVALLLMMRVVYVGVIIQHVQIAQGPLMVMQDLINVVREIEIQLMIEHKIEQVIGVELHFLMNAVIVF